MHPGFPVRRGLARLRQSLFFPQMAQGRDRQCMTANTREPAHGCPWPWGSRSPPSRLQSRFQPHNPQILTVRDKFCLWREGLAATRSGRRAAVPGALVSLSAGRGAVALSIPVSRHQRRSRLRQPCPGPALRTTGCPARQRGSVKQVNMPLCPHYGKGNVWAERPERLFASRLLLA